jgi:IclR family transcriptional regulator, pca regulon regulatory protein
MGTDGPGDTSLTFTRGLAALQAVRRNPLGVTIAEVASTIDVSRAAARRFLLTLDHAGLVRLSGRRFLSTPRTAELGDTALTLSLWASAATILERVAAETGEASSLSVLDGNDIVYVARAPGRHVLAVSVDVGSRLPALFTSMGRVLVTGSSFWLQTKLIAAIPTPPTARAAQLAPDIRGILDDVATRGFALVEEELEPGLLALAVPVFARDDTVVAALNISSTPGRTNGSKMLADWLPILQLASRELTQAFLRHCEMKVSK